MKLYVPSSSKSLQGEPVTQEAWQEHNKGDESFDTFIDSSNIRQDDFFFSKSHPHDPGRLNLQYRVIGDIADMASSDMDFAEFCYYVARTITHATGAYGATLFLFSRESMLVKEVGRYSDIVLPNVRDQYVFPVTAGRLGRVMSDGKIIVYGTDAFHDEDLPPEKVDVDYSYGISVPIADGQEVLGSYSLLFLDRVYQSTEFLLTLSKVLASHIKLMERLRREEMNPGKTQLAVQILNSIESAIGPLAARSGVEQHQSVIGECVQHDTMVGKATEAFPR